MLFEQKSMVFVSQQTVAIAIWTFEIKRHNKMAALPPLKHRQVRCKKKHHPYSRREKTSQVEWSGSGMKRLHKRMKWAASQASRNGVLVKSGFAAWRCEVEPDGSVKWRLASSLFFCPEIKKLKTGVLSFAGKKIHLNRGAVNFIYALHYNNFMFKTSCWKKIKISIDNIM